ncbi:MULTISPECIES: acyl-CoA dehydrogenase family protein [unclassified Nocardioides]|uniref:acyl-CoA dehydrogenase family protein n=1 Tax=unclassified Nocardioides TaxID=2615069 RepID=UPI0009F0DD23|nr:MULTISPECIES: acyl-CoA dehydrogenase family protein [unclassified Nocardioides]GAW50464.1 acyl-CoA dehydrogenase domain-containing protein [Nocardioides sp. PD653-B2]GAW53903.1 acyl-CoA dehydrogenase domain-containing protein [Nocardioides sp. PD653]
MDFRFTQEQDEAAELAAGILKDRATNERLKAVEAEGDRFDRDLWAELGTAGLLGLALPEEHGGAGLGIIELCRVLVEVGRKVAPVPLAAHGPASRLIAELGSDAQQRQWLPGAASGATVLTAAVAEERAFSPERPTTAATPDGSSYRITGSKAIVPAGPYADAFLVPAETPSGVGVFLVQPGDPGVTVVAQTFSDGDGVARLDLDAAEIPADRLVGETDGVADDRLRQLLVLAASAEQLGITEGALKLTSTYAKTREQFGRPIGTFQAVSQRLADGFIDVLAQRLALWQAAWRVQEGLPADSEIAIAKLWAADAGHRLAHTTVHVHGGVGIDLDGEAHRYFTSAKRFEFLHGGSTEQALNVGRILAAEPA